MNRLGLVCGVAVMLCAGEVTAQVIPVKTVPIAEGDQFTFLPSANRGMAHVSIALRDSVLDPFNNPATAGRLRTGYAFGAMTSYVLSRNAGDGTTLPAGVIARSRDGAVFAGFAAALQRLTPGGRNRDGIVVADAARLVTPGSEVRTAESNQYAYAVAGRSFGSKVSFAGSLAWSRLGGVDGADLLYPGSRSVEQRGDVLSLRAGLSKDWENGRSVEAVVVHNRSSAAHDVRYEDLLWIPVTRTVQIETRSAHNYDRSHLWGVQLKYLRPLADTAWRVGALLTANRTTHPTIPTLGMMTLARDPGQAAAFNAGLGLSRRANGVTYAADAVYEPIWARGIDGANDNHYRFSNGILRGAVQRDFQLSPGTAEIQLGVQAHSIGYTLDQRDVRQLQPQRRSRERWSEWVHAVGLGYGTTQFHARYQWRLTSGVERLGILQPGNIAIEPLASSAIFPAPFQQPMSMFPIRVTTQQFSVSVPLR